jgi:transposase-like protein
MLDGPWEQAMSTYRIFTTAFKRDVAQEYLAGASLNALGRKHEVARNLIRIWVAKYQAGEYEPDFIPMPRLSAHEVKIAELERMVGKLTMELEFLRGVLKSTPPQRGATTSIVTGPVASQSNGDATS